MKLQLNFLILGVLNFMLKVVPGHFLRILLLRSVGAKIGSNVAIHRSVKIYSLIGHLEIGKNTTIGAYTILDNRRGIKIGSNCAISQGTAIYSLGHDTSSQMRETIGCIVKIGDNVDVYSRAIILPGVELGNSCVVGAGTVVTKSFEDNLLICGNPGKKVKIVSNKRKIENYRYWLGI